jgi:signal recognition particle subunit SRP54
LSHSHITLPQEDEVIAFQKRLEADAFDFNDFLDQFKRMNNMGGLQMLKLMPGFSGVSEKQLYEVEKKLKKYEGMISSMTPEVRGGGRGGGGRGQGGTLCV